MKFLALFLVIFMTTTEIIEARSRFGRSFGRRSSRSFFSNKKKSPSRLRQKKQQTTKPSTAKNINSPKQTPRRSGSFMRTMMGAVAGTMIGALLFKTLGTGGTGFGLIILLIIGAFFLLRRKGMQHKQRENDNKSPLESDYKEDNYTEAEDETYSEKEDETYSEKEQVDLNFTADEKFTSDRSKDFFSIQHAWSKQDLTSVKMIMTNEVYTEFMSEITNMQKNKLTSTLENLMIKSSTCVASWSEETSKFATIKFDVSLIEYESNSSGEIVKGSKETYSDITEYWTFSQDEFGANWKVCAVENPE